MNSWISQEEERMGEGHGGAFDFTGWKTFDASDSTSDSAWPHVPFAVLWRRRGTKTMLTLLFLPSLFVFAQLRFLFSLFEDGATSSYANSRDGSVKRRAFRNRPWAQELLLFLETTGGKNNNNNRSRTSGVTDDSWNNQWINLICAWICNVAALWAKAWGRKWKRLCLVVDSNRWQIWWIKL